MSRSISITSIIRDIDHQSYRQRHPEYVARVAADRAKVEQREKGYDASTLPTFSKVALLWMHESQVKRALSARLLDGWDCYPSKRDFAPLVERGLCEWKPGKRQHDLTPEGVIAVKKLERDLCARFNIHQFIDNPVSVGWQLRYRCTCGSDYVVRKSPTAYGNAHSQWVREHATKAGIDKLYTALEPVKMAEG